MWLRFKIALLVLIRGEDALLDPYKEEVKVARHLQEMAEIDRDFVVQSMQVVANEAMAHIKQLEGALAKQKIQEGYSIFSGFRHNKDDLPN